MDVMILPASDDIIAIRKDLLLPPDKSILHRILIIGSLTESEITIPITSEKGIPLDIRTTIKAMRALGVEIEILEDKIIIYGVGLRGLKKPMQHIDCENSGTSARVLMGLLAAQDFNSVLTGDESLSKRPMRRLADLLIEIGADITFPGGDGLPAHIHGKQLKGKYFQLPVASAQIKSALLLAGLFAEDETHIAESKPTRDHTERMLRSFGADIQEGHGITMKRKIKDFDLPKEFSYSIPGDISSASFLISAAIVCKKNIRLKNVSLNPGRRRFLDILIRVGLNAAIVNTKIEFEEEWGDIEIDGSSFQRFDGYEFSEEDIALCIDEIPAMAILASLYDGETSFRNVRELRKKESDRITSITQNFKRAGIRVKEFKEGFTISGEKDRQIKRCIFESFGDHRIAMAFSVLALRASEPVTIRNAGVVSVSFPGFFSELGQLAGKERIVLG